MNPISIIGAGIGGLTLGNILRQHNLDFTVYESAPEIKPVGSGIMMAINAMQIFDKLGLKEKIEKAGNKIHGISITDENLKLISQTHVSELEKKYSSCNVAIHRAELQKILAENLSFKNIKLNHSINTIKKDDNYLLQFENGHQTESKIVFGADGIHSRIRNQIFRMGTLRNTHQMCWRGLVDFNVTEKFYHEAIEAWGKGKRFGFVKMTDNKLYWYAVINKGKYNPNSSLSGNFHGFHPLINEIIESTSEENIILNDLLDLSPIPKWHTQNLCLIGDAAHATTPNLGQGACQAIEDAYIIGKLLEQNKNFNSIFEDFQKIRRKKVDHVVSTSWKLGKFSQWEKATYLRNALMRSVPERITRKMVERVIQLEM